MIANPCFNGFFSIKSNPNTNSTLFHHMKTCGHRGIPKCDLSFSQEMALSSRPKTNLDCKNLWSPILRHVFGHISTCFALFLAIFYHKFQVMHLCRLHNQQFGDQVLWREEPGEIINRWWLNQPFEKNALQTRSSSQAGVKMNIYKHIWNHSRVMIWRCSYSYEVRPRMEHPLNNFRVFRYSTKGTLL